MVKLLLKGFSLNNVNQLHCLLVCKQNLHLSRYNEILPEQGMLHSDLKKLQKED